MPTPAAKANADAAWPEGNDVDRGIATRRGERDVMAATVGPPTPGQWLDQEVDDGRADCDGRQAVDGGMPSPAPARGGQHPGGADPEFRVISGTRESTEVVVQCRGWGRRDRGVEGCVEVSDFVLPTGVCGLGARSRERDH